MSEQVVLLAELDRDLGEKPLGWAVELAERGIEVIEDDLGRAAVDREAARLLFSEHRAQQEVAARRRKEIEQRAVEAYQRLRASLPAGVSAGAVPPGMSALQLVMANDPMLQVVRRESPIEHALARRDGAAYHPIQPEQASQ
jgi:hypothetical protein